MSVMILFERYEQMHRKLHQREPTELRDLGAGWVVVNGARMQIGELERLVDQMQGEYRQAMAQKRSVIKRLVAWLREA